MQIYTSGWGSGENLLPSIPIRSAYPPLARPPQLFRRRAAPSNLKLKAVAISAPQTLAAAMAFLAPAAAASSLRAPTYVAASSGRRSVLPAAVKATASSGSGSATSPHPILSSLRMAASAAVLLAATSFTL